MQSGRFPVCWRSLVLPKHWHSSFRLYSDISQKAVIFIVTTFTTSDVASNPLWTGHSTPRPKIGKPQIKKANTEVAYS